MDTSVFDPATAKLGGVLILTVVLWDMRPGFSLYNAVYRMIGNAVLITQLFECDSTIRVSSPNFTNSGFGQHCSRASFTPKVWTPTTTFAHLRKILLACSPMEMRGIAAQAVVTRVASVMARHVNTSRDDQHESVRTHLLDTVRAISAVAVRIFAAEPRPASIWTTGHVNLSETFGDAFWGKLSVHGSHNLSCRAGSVSRTARLFRARFARLQANFTMMRRCRH